MDDERRVSTSGESKWNPGGFSGEIMSREEAYRAVYADRKEEEAGESDDDIFNEWAENLEEEVREIENLSKEPAEHSREKADDEETTENTGEDGDLTEPSELPEETEIGAVPAEHPGEEKENGDLTEPSELPEETEIGAAPAEHPGEEKEDEDLTEPSELPEETEIGAVPAEHPGEEKEDEDLTELVEASGDEAEQVPADSSETDENHVKNSAPNSSDEKQEEDPEKEKRRKKIIAGIAGLAVVLVIAGIQIHKSCKEFYTTHFFRGTVIDGHDVSKMTVEEVKDEIKKKVSKYTLKIKELERNEKITAADVGLEYVDDGKIDELMEEQEEGKWLLHLAGTSEFDINAGTRYDNDKVTEKIASLECFKEENVTKPQDATLKDENNVFSIQDEVEGNEVNLEKFTKAVTDALDKGETSIDIVRNDCYNHPTVFRDDETLKARMDKWNEYMRVNVTYAFGDNIETVNGDTVKPNVVDDGTNVELPTDWIRTLVYDWGQKYDTFGLARPFTTHSGEEVMIEEGGDYGWVIDKDATIADVTDAVLTGAQGERTPTFLYSAMGWDNGDLTGTYVEVSISEQHLWCYKDYELVMDTDVVTGLPTTERATAKGCFAIDAKKEDATLGSLDVQGYESPVSFWAPFNGGQGLHDAPWRDDFGGDIYEGDGSHGCVNIPPWNMEAIYNAIEIGNAVVIY